MLPARNVKHLKLAVSVPQPHFASKYQTWPIFSTPFNSEVDTSSCEPNLMDSQAAVMARGLPRTP